MIREEQEAAIAYINGYRKLDEDLHNTAPKDSVAYYATDKCLKYWDMAIQALEKANIYDDGEHYVTISKALYDRLNVDTCTDAVSRQAVLDGLRGCICDEWVKTLFATMVKQLPSVNPQPCDDAISRILKRMWNCRGKHTTSIDKVKMEQIIRDELSPVTKKTLECNDTVSRGVFEQVMRERDIAIEQLHELGYELGQKIEPCEDAISRSDMLDAVGHGTTYTSEEVQKIVNNLSPVTPQQKTGHWIHFAQSDDCSECGWSTGKYISPSNFCPDCGVKMESE